MQTFRELLESDRIHVFDGAMGTMLYAKGVYINRCYDELNLSNPDLVREIHAEYLHAGAEIIETNTFGATAYRLHQYGLEGSLEDINVAAARIAREAAGEDALRRRCNRSTRFADRALWTHLLRRSKRHVQGPGCRLARRRCSSLPT